MKHSGTVVACLNGEICGERLVNTDETVAEYSMTLLDKNDMLLKFISKTSRLGNRQKKYFKVFIIQIEQILKFSLSENNVEENRQKNFNRMYFCEYRPERQLHEISLALLQTEFNGFAVSWNVGNLENSISEIFFWKTRKIRKKTETGSGG